MMISSGVCEPRSWANVRVRDKPLRQTVTSSTKQNLVLIFAIISVEIVPTDQLTIGSCSKMLWDHQDFTSMSGFRPARHHFHSDSSSSDLTAWRMLMFSRVRCSALTLTRQEM